MLDLLPDALGDGRQDEIVAAQILDRDRAVPGEERVACANEHRDRLGPSGSRAQPSGTAGS